MWKSLTSLSDADFRHIASLPGDCDSTELADTIRLVSKREYADQLSAVTSLGHLSVTTALTYSDHHHHWHHPRIAIWLTPERKITVSYNPGGEKNPKDTASSVLNTPQEAADYVDILVNRMPYDTDRILAAIAKANERKQAYERRKTEPEH